MTKPKKNDIEQIKDDLAVARADLRGMYVLATNALRLTKNAGGLSDYELYHDNVRTACATLAALLERKEEQTSITDPRGWHNARLSTLLPIKERLEDLLLMVNNAVDQAEKREQAKNKSNLRRIAG